ncbi:MAG TPA: GNAT family N-acetyltransferase [Thermoanaerobaculia bacterium]|nr:GNAT family N-acetyltransferase [Thermoanaerobaculia bacterium]
MIRTATRKDLPYLRELFARANDAPYDLAAVAEEKCFAAGIAGKPVVRVIDGKGAAVTCGKWLRVLIVERGSRGRGVGSELLRDSNATVIAAEPGNYFTPGVPENLRGFFERSGYIESASTWNLDCSTDFGAAGDVRRPAHEDRERVLAFVEREFGRIWRFEAAKAFEREIPPAFVSEENGELTGFAVHDVNNRGLGWFGPTGVTKSMRGRGIGCRLLLASLADLRRLGYPRAIIPWTDALEFYRKCCGAEAAYRFFTMARRDR